MKCYIVDIEPFWVLIEYHDSVGIQRKWISRDFYSGSTKRIHVDIEDNIAMSGMGFSNVDLVENLGEYYGTISVRELEQALRKAGLWERADYQKNPDIVQKVVQNFSGIDTTTIINAALRENQYG